MKIEKVSPLAALLSSEKAKIRITIKERIQSFSPEVLSKKSASIQENLARFLLSQSGRWGAFQPLSDEPKLDWEQLKSKNLHFSFPRLEKSKRLVFSSEGPFQVSPQGIHEPTGPSQAAEQFCGYIIPGRAFSESGDRLGRGQGYYDQYLKGLNDIKVGVAFEEQVFSTLPAEAHDVRMNYVITEHRVIKVGDF